MIKLLGLLFIFLPIYGKETFYHTPHNHTDFIHYINKTLKQANHVFILTSSYAHYDLQKGILNCAKNGGTITLIAHDISGSPLSMIQYQGVNLYTSQSPLKQSIIVIDDTLVCSLDGAINEEDFASQHLWIRCSDDQNKIKKTRQSLLSIMKYSKPYLE